MRRPEATSTGHEIMPLDATRLLEARVVVAFWGRALHDPRMADVHASTTDTWRRRMTGYGPGDQSNRDWR
ncbi:TetR family transcriptional regulator C-terminal domain-containing protein [Streptomyces sp. VNUA24]|uniref:TetR family transcriptional regulator C-terminal domain-containing protein n=1 Tax=Streptomyces sp. VNUA24 TaxID=3031131 RepID=UPI0023B86116|nr:TetR family transcriptional regulator C-terminal domain-containing protein [Streptomyces sp. VNUA24]WEH13643.1 TetR family transcriptional regulator C-terminal domain-containing protein [Streptomyces sp. VNUA24]